MTTVTAAPAERPALAWPLLAAALALLALPWLTPHAGGPSASVQPWLFSAACAAAFALLWRAPRVHPGFAASLAALGAWALLRTGVTMDSLALAGGLLVIGLTAGAGGAALRQPRGADLIAASWIVAALASTAIALAQYFGAIDFLGPLASGSADAEAYGNLRQRNQFASLTAIGIAALGWRVAQRGLDSPALLAAAALAVGNAATTSRTGLLELLMLAVLAGLWRGEARRDAVRLLMFVLVVYALAAVALPRLQAVAGIESNIALWDRVAGVSQCSSRKVLWSNVLHLIAQRPGLGWGWGELDYAHYATLYEGPRFCDILDNAHNLPLHLAAELGLPAALLACGGGLWAVLRARPWSETDAARRMAWAVLAILALHSLLEYPLWYGPFQIALGLCLGILWAPQRQPSRAGALLLQLLLPALLGSAVAYAAWDYRRVSQIYLQPEDRLPAYRDATLEQVRRSRIFRSQAAFAELTLAPLTRATAGWTFEQAQALLHYSPEPKIIEKAIESATLLGREQDALWHLVRYRAAFPDAYAEWSKRVRRPHGAT